MNAVVPLAPRTDEPSPIELIAKLAVEMVLIAARQKGAALTALIRIAGIELAKIEGHEAAAMMFTRRARRHEDERMKAIRGRGS